MSCPLPGRDVHHPLQPHRIGAHGHIADPVLVTGKADPIVRALAEDDETAVGTHFGDCCIVGDLPRAG
jgi:hypothetical protein